ncbi:MAG: P1 family peptidase, partial [Pseudomonadota bacterium]
MSAHNCLTDVTGVHVGHADDSARVTGATAILVERPNVASVFVPGGAPGSRDTELLAPQQTVDGVDAIVLSGGSAFGLDAAGGVMALLAGRGVGLDVGTARVPIVPQAITFDLDASDGAAERAGSFYWDLGWRAAAMAVSSHPSTPVEIGSVGGGMGATTADLKGGLGTASMTVAGGETVAALAVVNAIGSVLAAADDPNFLAGGVERGAEFGGLGALAGSTGVAPLRTKLGAPPSTTIACIATDATLTKPEAKRLAIMASAGLARAVNPVFAPMDGDTIFTVAT